MHTLIQDLRFGLRMLFKHRGMTLAAVLALALGIGANTTMFTIINAVLLRPLPFPEPERLVHLDESVPKKGMEGVELSLPDFADWRDQSQSFEAMAVYEESSFTLSGTDKAERITGARVSAGLFPLLGIAAAQGRHFLGQEDKAGAPSVVIISQGLWQRRFGGQPNLVGQTLKINGQSATVVGIMPVDFRFPVSADMWMPLTLAFSEKDRGHHFCYGIGRLKPGVTVEQARAEIAGISARIAQTHPETNADVESTVKSWRDFAVEDADQVLWLLMGVVGFVLLIACANVANLMLARAAARQKEMAIRSALGASRWRIMRQLLAESVLLAAMGGVLGLMIALWGVDWLMKAIPDAVPTWIKFTIDARVLGFTCGAVLVTSVLFGLAPAWQAAKPDLNDVLKDSGHSGSGVWGRHRLRSLLVISEVALALVLLVGAGLMMKSFLRLREVNPGFRAEQVLTAKLSLPETQYPEAAQQTRFYQRLLQRATTLPGVESIAVTSNLPLSTEYTGSGFTIEGQPPPADSSQIPVANYGIISPGYFHTMGMTLHAGRDFTEADTESQPLVVIIDETIARRYFARENPLGKQLRFGGPQSGAPWLTIVGVVNAVRHWGIKEEAKMSAYLPYQQKAQGELVLVARTPGDPTALTTALRREVAALDKDLPLYAVRSMEEVVALSIWEDKYYGMLFGMFAVLALVLAAVGIYGVMSYTVTQRTHEIGIRVALGAQTSDVLKLVVRQGMTLAGIGVVIGLAAAFALTRLMSSLLFNVKATDPLTFVFISLLLAAVALLACYLPARRATKVDPMVALRYE